MIRQMHGNDLDEVLNIENDAFTEPWSRRSFEAELDKEYAICIVYEHDSKIVAYLIAWKIEEELHIANIAVNKKSRREGIARKLLKNVFSKYKSCHSTFLEVKRSNFSARQLYRDFGFKEMGVREKYYSVDGEDAILMEMNLIHFRE
ncbi:ribosomal protein S18-alanine N-acetyltransferase [bacterium]|nr:ribosomal protein S18-alanine N-acetyltransferase [bacterium]